MRRFLLLLPALVVGALGVLSLAACRGPGFKTDGKVGAAVFIEAGPRYGVGAEVKIPSLEIGGGAVAHPITGEAPQGEPARVERTLTPVPPAPPVGRAPRDARMAPGQCDPKDPDCAPPAPPPEPAVASITTNRAPDDGLTSTATVEREVEYVAASDGDWVHRAPSWSDVYAVAYLDTGGPRVSWEPAFPVPLPALVLAAAEPVVASGKTDANDDEPRPSTTFLVGAVVVLGVVALLWWAARDPAQPSNDTDSGV